MSTVGACANRPGWQNLAVVECPSISAAARSLAMFAAIRRVSLFRLPTDMLTVTPHAIFKPVHPGRPCCRTLRLCEVVNNFGRHSEASGQGVSRDCREQRFAPRNLTLLSIDHRHPLQSHTAHVHTGAVVGFNKPKMEDTRRHEAEKEAAAHRATDRQMLEDAEQLVTAWNERQAERMPMLFRRPSAPPSQSAIGSCERAARPAARLAMSTCGRSIGSGAAVTALTPTLSCRSCRPQPVKRTPII